MLKLVVRLYDNHKNQVKQTQFYRAKYFHVFLREKTGKLKRLTLDIESIPSEFKLAGDKRYYVESAVDYFVSSIKKPRKKKAPKVKPQVEKFPDPEISNYELPPRPSINRLSKEVTNYVTNLVTKKVSTFDIPWDSKRIKGFVKSLSEYFAGKNLAIPTDRKFIDTLVVVNLGYTGGQGFDGIIESAREEIDFLESLHEREVTKNYFTDASVKFQTKEIFRHNHIKEMVSYTTKSGNILKYREQTILLQMELKYNEIIRVDQLDIMNESMGFQGPISRVKADIKFLFQYALDKGIFNYTEKYVYSVRLVTPLMTKGLKLGERVDAGGEISNGYGYSCPRAYLSSYSDIDKIIDSLFDTFKTDMLTYLARSSMTSFAFEGLVIERLLNP